MKAQATSVAAPTTAGEDRKKAKPAAFPGAPDTHVATSKGPSS